MNFLIFSLDIDKGFRIKKKEEGRESGFFVFLLTVEFHLVPWAKLKHLALSLVVCINTTQSLEKILNFT